MPGLMVHGATSRASIVCIFWRRRAVRRPGFFSAYTLGAADALTFRRPTRKTDSSCSSSRLDVPLEPSAIIALPLANTIWASVGLVRPPALPFPTASTRGAGSALLAIFALPRASCRGVIFPRPTWRSGFSLPKPEWVLPVAFSGLTVTLPAGSSAALLLLLRLLRILVFSALVSLSTAVGFPQLSDVSALPTSCQLPPLQRRPGQPWGQGQTAPNPSHLNGQWLGFSVASELCYLNLDVPLGRRRLEPADL